MSETINVLENKLVNLILSSSKLPGFRIDPSTTYERFKTVLNIEIKHPKDIYKQDVKDLKKVAEYILYEHRLKFAVTGVITGLPGGIISIATTAVDIEEYLRRMFILAQQLGHVFGLIPHPLADDVNKDLDSYFEDSKEDILNALLIGLGASDVNIRIGENKELSDNKQNKHVIGIKITEQVTVRLAKRIARLLIYRFGKKILSRSIAKIIPILGGAINATINYTTISMLGENLIKEFEKEFISLEEQVNGYWNNKDESCSIYVPECTANLQQVVISENTQSEAQSTHE